jgi:hypothetical protein
MSPQIKTVISHHRRNARSKVREGCQDEEEIRRSAKAFEEHIRGYKNNDGGHRKAASNAFGGDEDPDFPRRESYTAHLGGIVDRFSYEGEFIINYARRKRERSMKLAMKEGTRF